MGNHFIDLLNFRELTDLSLVNPLKSSKNSKSTTANIRMLGSGSGMESLDSNLNSGVESALDSKDFNIESSLDSTLESKQDSPTPLSKRKPTRGFGYWCWKPQIILQTLNMLKQNDILIYLDIGCTLHKEGRERLLEMISLVDKNEIMGVQLSLEEYKYTKSDIFAYFNVLDDEAITHSGQVESGYIFMKKTNRTLEIIQKWRDIFYSNFELATDSQSKISNHKDFIENRHDQSLWSVINKLYGLQNFSYERDIVPRNAPIKSSRDKFYFIKTKEDKALYIIALVISKILPKKLRIRVRDILRQYKYMG